MKKTALSLCILLFTHTLFAGGDISPVEDKVPVVLESDSAYYIGAGFANLEQNSDNINILNGDDIGINVNTLFLQAGYQYNKYLSFEARYWLGVSDASISQTGEADKDVSGSYSGWGLYLKPTYPLGDFTVYALLGYGSVDLESDKNQYYWNSDQFSWGLGGAYAFNDNISLFIDYISMTNRDDFVFHHGDDFSSPATADIGIRTINAGITYKF